MSMLRYHNVNAAGILRVLKFGSVKKLHLLVYLHSLNIQIRRILILVEKFDGTLGS